MVRIFEPPGQLWKYVHVGINVEVPDATDLEPRAGLANFKGTQPYKLVIFGEKSSLEDVLTPIAETYKADLYLPTGEISDTLLHKMASVGAEDGRPMVVFTFSDCDPAGWQMPISIARKLQAFKASLFPELDFEVRRVGLIPDQVREYGLPSTPLKDTERRADRWTEAMGVEQTEIDALASLRPELLRQLARGALDSFYDRSLSHRVSQVRQAWLEEAQAAIDEQMDQDQLERIRQEADAKLAELREEIDALNDALRVSADGIRLPAPPEIPAAEVAGSDGLPLLDSGWSFAHQCRRLIDSKAYRS